ncbi:MAG TPA: methyltransferase domain-containing protein [Rhizomicrobium sp.]|jgi:SAM-dependent methyltransferase|nr:methyltransferase domain-containing protein [Rhizomicrobium sp.]
MNALRPPLFDFAAGLHARRRALKLAGDRFLDRAAAEGLADRLSAVTRKFGLALWVGAPASEGEPSKKMVPPEIAPFAQDWVRADFQENEILEVGTNDSGKFDLAVSLFSLQTINDLPGALVQIRRALKPDGLFVGTLLGGGTLSELRDAFAVAESGTRGGVSPRVSPFADVRDMGGLLQRAGFALPVTDVERLTVRYSDFFALTRDLRAHGFTNVMSERSRTLLRRDTLAALVSHYAAQHADPDGKLRARFETLHLTGWSPHDSQQKPLAPGSAKARLAEALGTTETIMAASKPDR